METPSSVEPFRFKECVYLVEPTGRWAGTLREFCRYLRTVPASSIFYHMHQYFLRSHFETPDFTNDFSNWAASHLEERALAEKLANIDPFEFASIDPHLRNHLLGVVEAYLNERPKVGDVPVTPFYFESSTTLVVDGPIANDLTELRTELAEIETSSLYYHVFLAHVDSGRGNGNGNDHFIRWLERNYDAQPLIDEILAIDPYMHSLEELRSLILRALDRHLPHVRQRGTA